jgi:exodeoxyribonuclease VII large subunit
LSPLGVLQRGYSITRGIESGVIIRQAVDVKIGQDIDIRLAKGNLNAKIEKIFTE